MGARLQTLGATIFHVMNFDVGLTKLSARWVPWVLTAELKQRRLEEHSLNDEMP